MYVYATLWGILIGLLVSATFHIYSKRTTNMYTRVIFGVDTDTVIKNLLVANILFLVVLFGWLSLFIRDMTFPMDKPFLFFVETLAAGILPASTLFIIYYVRNIPLGRHAWYGFFLLVLKCMLAHVLLQVSGVYHSLLK
jgi:hypothetical protein